MRRSSENPLTPQRCIVNKSLQDVKLTVFSRVYLPNIRMKCPLDYEDSRDVPSRAPPRSSRVGSAVKWTLAALLGTGAAGGVGYTVHRQNELADENSAMRQTLSEEQMLRMGIQKRLDTQVTLDDMDDAVEMVTPATVRVEGQQWLGSGTILTDRTGRMFIYTNGHVTEDNELRRGEGNDFRDGVYRVTLYTGSDFQKGISFDAAPVIGSDGKRAHSYSNDKDIAVLRIPPEIERQIAEGKIRIPRIPIANRVKNPIRAGDRVIVVGNPFGERDHVTDGIVSNSEATGLSPWGISIRTSAPINGGNSGGFGGRVRREDGKLIVEYIGIPAWGYRGGDGVSGMIDVRVIALQSHAWGIPLVPDEEIAAYQRWWNEEIVPFQKARGIVGGGSGGTMPPAND